MCVIWIEVEPNTNLFSFPLDAGWLFRFWQIASGLPPFSDSSSVFGPSERHGRQLAKVAEATGAAPETPLILSQKEKEAGLAAAAKPMLQQARRLATIARLVAADNARWRQARQPDAPVAYDGQIRYPINMGLCPPLLCTVPVCMLMSQL